MQTMQDQLREAMAGVEIHARGNLEAVPHEDTMNAVKNLIGDQETDETEPETESTETAEAAEAEPDAKPVQETEEGAAEPVTLNDLAEQLEWEEGALYAVQMPMPDGQEPITVGDYKDLVTESRRIVSEHDTAKTELDERETDLRTREARLAEQLQHAAPAELIKAEAALQRVQDEAQSINWQALETENPGQAALMRQKLGSQLQQATAVRDGIKANLEQLQQDLANQNQQAHAQHLQQAAMELHRLIPSWADQATFKAESEAMVVYGIEQGIDEAVLRSIADPKLLNYIYRHWQTDKKLEAAKPVEKPPKVLKPQAVKNRNAGRKAKKDNLVANAAKTSDMRVKTAAVTSLLSGE